MRPLYPRVMMACTKCGRMQMVPELRGAMRCRWCGVEGRGEVDRVRSGPSLRMWSWRSWSPV